MKQLYYNHIDVGTWNIQGLFENTNGFKTCKLNDDEFQHVLRKHDILCLQETHCKQTDIKTMSLKGFTIKHFARKTSANNRAFGGLMLIYRNFLAKGIKIIEQSTPDKIWIKLDKNFFGLSSDLYICFVYISPDSSPYFKSLPYDIFNQLDEETARFRLKGNVLLAGDLNARTNTREDFVDDNNDKHSPINDINSYKIDNPIKRNNKDNKECDSHGEKLIEFCKTNYLRILNGRFRGDKYGSFTRFPMKTSDNPSVIDYMVIDASLFHAVNDFKVLPFTLLSDHCCITTIVNTNVANSQILEPTSNNLNINREEKFLANKESLLLFETALKSDTNKEKLSNFTNNPFNESQQGIDDAFNTLKEVIITTAEQTLDAKKHIKLKNKRPKKQQQSKKKWFNDECRKLKSRLNSAKKLVQANPLDPNSRLNFLLVRREYKRCLRKSEKSFRNSLTNKLLDMEGKDPKSFWKIIDDMRSWGSYKNDPGDCIEPSKWVDHFKVLFSDNQSPVSKAETTIKLTELEKRVNFCQSDYRISNNEILEAIKKLKLNKSPGPDRVISEFIIYGKEVLAEPLCKLFNMVFRSAVQPSEWSLNFLRPIHKKGATLDPDNYRGIAVNSCFSKLYSLILLRRLETEVSLKCPISINQIGFQKSKRTADHTFVLKTLIDKAIRKQKRMLYTVFIDFRKAYDTINRNLLLLKLQQKNIQGFLYKNLKTMYENISYCIKTQGGFLDPTPSEVGLRQGCVLSPLLFNIYIDDMKNIFTRDCDPVDLDGTLINHLLYADDVIVMSSTSGGLKRSLERIEEFCSKWKLTINIDKSKCMIFNAQGRLMTNETFKIAGQDLEFAQQFCYLGIDISAGGSFIAAKRILKEKGMKALYPITDTIFKFNLKPSKAILLFNHLIKPIITYGSEILAPFTKHQLDTLNKDNEMLSEYALKSEAEKVHIKFCKTTLGLKRNCPTLAVLGELGEFPVTIYMLATMVKFWHRIATLSDNSLVHLAYNEVRILPEDKNDWLNSVKFILKLIDMEHIYINANQISSNVLYKKTLKKLNEIFNSQWCKKVNQSSINSKSNPKLRTYKLFKKELRAETYLNLPQFKFRKLIAKFRCSDHQLRIETGRHQKLEISQRTCGMCKSGKVENEIHFLIECEAYCDLRQTFLGPNLNSILAATQIEYAFINVLTAQDISRQNNFAQFLQQATELRTKTLMSIQPENVYP